MNWLHRLLNPHCPHCIEQQQEDRHCRTCDILQMELASIKMERDKLLSRILNPKTVDDEIIKSEEMKPIMPKSVPWNVRKQMLEAEDREKAKLMKNVPTPIDELEKEVLGAD